MLYFAYGSNIDRDQMHERCPGARSLGRAVLDGHRLAFAGHSASWGGGVATVVQDPEGQVAGLLYRVTEVHLAALDGYEGHPWVYRRSTMIVRDGRGRRRNAEVYVMPRSTPRSAPSPAYYDVLKAVYEDLGFDVGPLEAAGEEGGGRGEKTNVFVYGTLMAGEANHRLLAGAQALRQARTEARFTLLDLGNFPAMVPGGHDQIHGEIYAVDAPTLAALDRLEGHPHFYRREVISLDDGRAVLAYLLPAGWRKLYTRISSGDWRLRQTSNRFRGYGKSGDLRRRGGQ